MVLHGNCVDAIPSVYIFAHLLYDASGTLVGMMYRTPSYAANTFDVFWHEKKPPGDITAVYNSAGTKVTTYTYDDLGQLISEVKGNTTLTYTYDNAGNITSITSTTEQSGGGIPDPGFKPVIKAIINPSVVTTTNTLGYSNSQWGDLLTSYNGTAITYDGIGNPLSYYNGTSYTFTWEGRRLVGAVKGAKTMSFAYNDEGIRTSKTVNGVTTTYYVNGGQIVAESNNSRTIVYIYDVTGSPIGMMYRTPSYAANTWDVFWYEKNLQGDIIAVCNSEGTKLISYNYSDAWGNYTVSYANGGGSTGAIHNPFRYRGYYYDTDLSMYYLQSRYYDAKICRFISADSYISTGQGMISFNMFAYCNNNPVNYYDPCGDNLIELINEIIEKIKRFLNWATNASPEEIREDMGGSPADGNTLGAAEPTITNPGNFSHSIYYYNEGGGSHMVQSMYEDFYGVITWFD